MSVFTKGIITKDVDAADIVNAVHTLFDKEANSRLEPKSYMGYENDFEGRIIFKFEDKTISLFVCKTEDAAEDTEFDHVLHTNFLIGCTQDNIAAMTKLVSYFGGYIDFDDSDEIGYQKVGQDGTVHPPVLEVTWDAIYAKFGRVVKIKSDRNAPTSVF